MAGDAGLIQPNPLLTMTTALRSVRELTTFAANIDSHISSKGNWTCMRSLCAALLAGCLSAINLLVTSVLLSLPGSDSFLMTTMFLVGGVLANTGVGSFFFLLLPSTKVPTLHDVGRFGALVAGTSIVLAPALLSLVYPYLDVAILFVAALFSGLPILGAAIIARVVLPGSLTAQPALVCSVCGHANPAGNSYCGKCSRHISDETKIY